MDLIRARQKRREKIEKIREKQLRAAQKNASAEADEPELGTHLSYKDISCAKKCTCVLIIGQCACVRECWLI